MSMNLTEQTARRLIEGLDGVTAWLAKISSQLAAQEAKQAGSFIEQAGMIQSLLELLVAETVPSSPAITREETINAVTPTLLHRNQSIPYQRITVTNDDPAQMCWIGKRNVSQLNGEVLLAQDQRPYVLPQGDDLWAICAVGTISVRISEGFDLVGMTQVIRPAER